MVGLRSAYVVDGGRGSSRSALAATRALAAARIDVVVGVADENELAARSKGVVEVTSVPRSESPEFADVVAAQMKDRQIEVVFATSDLSLRALALPGADLVDKELLAARAAHFGLPMPETTFFESVHDIGREVDLPVVVKPVVGSAPAIRVGHREQLSDLPRDMGAVAVQPYLAGPIHAFAGVMWDGMLRAAVHQRYARTWPVDCGTSSSAVTIAPDHYREASITEFLHDHRGVFQAQYLDGYLIDVNPRPYGSMPLALASGCNLPAIAWSLQHELASPIGIHRAREGIWYRWLEGDLRHVISQMASRQMSPLVAARSLRPRRSTAHSLWDVNDLGPVMLRGRQVAQAIRENRRS